MRTQPAVHARRAELGNALLVVVVLLLLASLFVLFALNVGRFEQKTSGNDLRAKIVQEVADSGIAQGVEYLNANRTFFATDARWRLCAANESAFPCGAVPAARRGTMYTYVNAQPGSALADRLIPLPAAMPRAGGFDATQQVSAVLCRVKAIPAAGPGTTECATDLAEASSTWVVTVVSKAALTGEGSSATATQTIGAYNIFSFGPSVPPLVASGTVAVGGGFQVVTAQDAAGPGIPTSIWTRLDVDTNGTPNTCFFDDFMREGGTSSGPRYYDGIAVCDTCKCPTGNSLSYGQGGNFCEGADIVDIEANDANPAGCPTSPNLSIRREEFPRDLFAFLFGISAWNDVDRDGIASGSPCTTAALDCNFSEQRIIQANCTFPDPATGAERTASLPADTCHLLNLKNVIHIGDGVDDARNAQRWASTAVASSGCMSRPSPGCPDTTAIPPCRGLDQIGTPSHPVALIYDGALTQVHFKLYGLYFGREPNASTVLSKTTGGSAELGMNGGATIYGAAVVQGMVTSGGGGTAAVVYNKDVLFNLINDPGNFEPASIPGSWTDRLRY
jgi:hypothetical protein